MKKALLFISSSLIFNFCLAQDGTRGFSEIKSMEDSLRQCAPAILKGKDDQQRTAANEKFRALLLSALEQEDSFDYPFDSLKTIAILTSPDKSFRIFNWNMPKKDGTYEYFGYVQTWNKKKKKSEIFTLEDKSAEIKSPENQTLGVEKWYGAHYYKLIQTKHKKEKFYTLLGIDWNDNYSNKKIIETISFQKNGVPKFGDPILKSEKKTMKRVIFEYSETAIMSLRYNEDEGMIVFDHLSPPNESLIGQYQFYGPDFSYDAFKFVKGKWNFIPDYGAVNEASDKDKEYNAPPSQKKRD
jgi:hypothetical protein